jgi:hypothetical protein
VRTTSSRGLLIALAASVLVPVTVGLTAPGAAGGAAPAEAAPDTIRVATYNLSLNRNFEGQLIQDLSTGTNAQAQAVAEVIQRTQPDVVLLNEFDFDPGHVAADLFRANYLAVSQNGAEPIEYPYAFVASSNTGIPSGFDLNNNGVVGGPDDAFGFGFFPGQFGMAVLSRYPIETDLNIIPATLKASTASKTHASRVYY